METYESFLASKARTASASGIDVAIEHPWLWGFQREAVRWALAGARRALFEETGLGKTRQLLAWANEVCAHTRGRVLVLAPLAVGPQTVREAVSVGLEGVAFDQTGGCGAHIVVTNYDRADRFDASDFGGVVLDESSILKNYMGSTQAELRDQFRHVPFRLCATATPAPNDYVELGTHAEFLGYGTRTEMLARYFVNDLSDTKTWKVKGHAEEAFWAWVASWALCAEKPSDVGHFDDSAYVLPPLRLERHVVDVDLTDGREDGQLFRAIGLSATGLHKEKRRTAEPRATKAAEIVAAEPDEAWVVWVDTDYEAEAVMAAIPGAVEVAGSMSTEVKTDRLMAFADRGGVLVTKPKIAGFGMNWQHAARMLFVGGSYSYEAFYQAVRREWRFGQKREVIAHVIMAVTEQGVWDVVTGKADAHAEMKAKMMAASRAARKVGNVRDGYTPTCAGRLPAWLYTHRSEE